MEKLITKRELLIANKIFTKDDLISLVKLFISLSNTILEKSKEIKRREMVQEGWKEQNVAERYVNTSHSVLEFTSSDNLKHTFTFEDNPETISILEKKDIVEINLYFTENVLDSKFVIKLRSSDSLLNSSYALVEGSDKDWVNTTAGSVENFLSGCKDQAAFINKLKILIIALTMLIINVFLFNLIEYFIRTKVMFPKIVGNLFAESLIYVIIVLSLISVTPAVLVYRRIKKLFPSIEIQTGYDFHHAETDKHNKLLLIASILIIPAVASFLLYLLS